MKRSWSRFGHLGLAVSAATLLLSTEGCRTTKPPVVDEPLPPVVETPPVVEPQPTIPVVDVPPPAPENQTYIVRKGDSLSRIAVRHGVRVRELIELNQIADPNKLRVGQTLVLPPHAKAQAGGGNRVTGGSKATPTGGRKARTRGKLNADGTYTVGTGDTLSDIAQAHKTTVSALKAANNLSSDRLRVGQKLTLPGAAAPAPTPAPPAVPVIPDVPAVPLPETPALPGPSAIEIPPPPPAPTVPAAASDLTPAPLPPATPL